MKKTVLIGTMIVISFITGVCFVATTHAQLCTLDPKFEETTLAQGMKYYTDRTYTLTSVPSQYVGLSAIKTPNNERNMTMASGYITFTLAVPSTVYVAYDSRITTLPAWMSGFTDTGDRILTSLSTQPSLIIYRKDFPAGCVDLGGNKASPASAVTASNYVVLYGTPTCTLDPKFQVTTLTQGMKYYTDRDYTLTSVPSQYEGLTTIKTPNNERNSTMVSGYMRFTLAVPSLVYVAYDSRITTLPAWMSGFTDTGVYRIPTSLSTQPSLKIYMKVFPAGCVDLGANKASPASAVTASNFIVFYDEGVSECPCFDAGLIARDKANCDASHGLCGVHFTLNFDVCDGCPWYEYEMMIESREDGGPGPAYTRYRLTRWDEGFSCIYYPPSGDRINLGCDEWLENCDEMLICGRHIISYKELQNAVCQ